MDYRKLIKFGSSSYVVSLPGSWLKKNKLVKGDIIHVEEDGDSRLILHSGEEKKQDEKEILIETKNKALPRIQGEIYNAYIDGYDVIKLIGEDVGTYSKKIRDIMNNFVAIEIIEQTNDKIIAKNFLNVMDVKIPDVIRRIDIILRSMLEDCVKCVEGDSCESVVDRDIDVNRLSFMLERILRNAMDDPGVSRQIGMSGTGLLHLWYIVMNMESVGDEVKRISRYMESMKFDSKQKNYLKKLFGDIEQSYLDVMKAYYKNDKELAFDVNFRKDKLHERCDDFYEKFYEENNLPKLSAMIEKMKALVAWIRTIALFIYATRFR